MIDSDTLAALAGAGMSDPQVAAALGVSSRTVLRARARYGIPSTWRPQTAPCGTRSAYGRGCRCDACRAANAAHGRAQYRRAAYARWEAITGH